MFMPTLPWRREGEREREDRGGKEGGRGEREKGVCMCERWECGMWSGYETRNEEILKLQNR